nr:hypothetical protein [Nitrosomonas nitrosa]
MSDGINQEIGGARDQFIDVQRLIEAVRGSRAARVLYEFRHWNVRSADRTVGEACSGFTAWRSDQLDCPNVIQL